MLAAVRLDGAFDALPDGLDTSLTSTSVSGGQRQRIALARAILKAPEVLLLDEATAQVDGLTESAIHDCIRDLAARGAVVTVAHRLSTVLDADTILVMEDGRVRARGTHEELLGVRRAVPGPGRGAAHRRGAAGTRRRQLTSAVTSRITCRAFAASTGLVSR